MHMLQCMSPLVAQGRHSCSAANYTSFDHLVRPGDGRRRHSEADHKLKLGRRLNRQIPRISLRPSLEPKAATALPPQDDHLMSEATSSSSGDARLRKRNESKETRADRIVTIPPDRTAIAEENLQAFPIVHSPE
jgi:hypothetical protein